MGNQKNTKLQAFWQGTQAVYEKTGQVCGGIGKVLNVIWKILYHLRKIFLAVPVVIVAMRLAQTTKEHLQGAFRFHILDVADTIEQASLVIRQVEVTEQVAVVGPMIITGGCLLLMFLSRRTMFPWLISVFSLIIPIFVLVSGMLPG